MTQTAWSGPKPLTCAYCQQPIGLLATWISFNSGDRVMTLHLSCHQQLLKSREANAERL